MEMDNELEQLRTKVSEQEKKIFHLTLMKLNLLRSDHIELYILRCMDHWMHMPLADRPPQLRNVCRYIIFDSKFYSELTMRVMEEGRAKPGAPVLLIDFIDEENESNDIIELPREFLPNPRDLYIERGCPKYSGIPKKIKKTITQRLYAWVGLK